ncbi:SRPBCC family protein (plasmid) [Nocardioides sp. R1-1]|uniref:SRPBCC family protein n=1 Tax=Nocardioides sp. R1-1 TaxID=3383502 RepID=UPI0038D15293
MQLSNSFTIDRPLAEVYQAFLQVERIATCMPGSTLLGQPEPGTYEGEVKVKVGPLGVTYAGQFVILDADEAAHRLTMRAKGREKRGAGNADAHIVATLSESPAGTVVQVDADLDIRGKVAQFGRGVIGEVTDGIMQTFARNLEDLLRSGGVSGPAPATSGGATAPPDVLAAAAAAPGPAPAPEPAAAPAGAELDAWALIVRPMLQRHGAGIASVVLSGLAAWVGARAGARSGARRRYFEHR